MPGDFLAREKDNGFHNMPVSGQVKSGNNPIQSYEREGAEPNSSTEENQELEAEPSIQTSENSPRSSKSTPTPQNLPFSRHLRNKSPTRSTDRNSKRKTQNALNNSRTSNVMIHNQAPDSDTDSARGDRSERVINYKKSVNQRATFNDFERSSRRHRTYPSRSDDTGSLSLDGDEFLNGTDSQSDETQSINSKNNSVSESVSLSDTIANALGPDIWVDPFASTSRFTSGQVTPIDETNTNYNVTNHKQDGKGLLFTLAKVYSISPENKQYRSDMPSMTGSRAISDESVRTISFEKENQSDKASLQSSATCTDSSNIKLSSKSKSKDDVTIKIHIADLKSRQDYLLKLCHSLMAFGAPTHRLEEYLNMTARVLEVQGSFLYIPGCMIVSFDNVLTNTNEVKLVKTVGGCSLGLLVDVHDIYKEVIHDVISVEEASLRLDKINGGPPIWGPWIVVLFYGFASAFVAPWAFQGGYFDMPVAFLLGSTVGFLQHIVAPKCDLYNNLFEIAATIITSFLARAFGSIQNGEIFCFAALAQAALALALPGFIVLTGCLEMQSKSIVSGGVRMVYGLIISFFLGFGISVGSVFYGIIDPNATSATTCQNVLPDYQKWALVPFFAFSAGLANQARFKEAPAMAVIGFSGYIVNFLVHKKFPNSFQISNTLGAFTVGVLSNLYGRIHHAVAASAILPSLLVLVPSGIAAAGSLIDGLNSADRITNGGTTIINGTTSVPVKEGEDINKIVFNITNTMIQIAIGITVGLFMSTVLMYPFGKRRSGLFAY